MVSIRKDKYIPVNHHAESHDIIKLTSEKSEKNNIGILLTFKNLFLPFNRIF